MLDQVLIAQASLNTITVLTNLALVGVLLFVSGMVGRALTRRAAASRSRRIARGVSTASAVLGGAGLVLVAVVVVLAVLPRRAERHEWSVDLRETASLEPFLRQPCAIWPIGAREYRNCIYEGRISLNAEFPGGRSISESGRALWAAGHDARLTSLHLFLDPMTREDAAAEVERLIEPWHLRREQFDAWRQSGDSDDRASYFTPDESMRAEPWLEVSVRRLDSTRGGDASRWAVSLKWHWAEAA